MIEIYMWCQLMTENGAETKKVKVTLTDETYCDIVCSKGVRYQLEENGPWLLIKENMCFYKEPINE